ncbi:Ribosomal silencing factor RsfA [hydrothermal vent metagenome]|uniref:Ribosomal silencing factor RsfA n=1 Tax=hydrothermal vent metagenome TaxID=652676 RepID=A0A3B1DB23_9ZZZZ
MVITLKSIEKARLAVKAALDKKAKNVLILELKDLSVMSDYFVICSGESTTHVRSIVDNIEEEFRLKKIKPSGIEGHKLNQWVLMDYSDVIVHVFEEETRAFYELEKLWLDAPRIDIEKEKNLQGHGNY